jgi:hypothetical protein
MSTSDYEGEFITNYYTIQINILYDKNIADGRDSKSDDDDDSSSKYYIINNMQDILLEEFRSESKYNSFKKNYTKDKITPLYIVNDSYYIDKYVMEAIGKVTTTNFPNYSSTTTAPIEQEAFKNNYNKFISDSNIDYYKELLFKIFKEACLKAIRGQAKQNDFAQLIKDSNITTLEKLYAEEKFIEITGSKTFYTIIKQIYETSPNINLKKALQLFYNIPNNKLSNKSKYEYFLNPETIINIFKVIDENSTSVTSERSYYGERNSLNTNTRKEAMYKEFYKYVFPNKTDITSLSDPDKDKILMFANIYYILKNVYLTDDTIINITSYRAKRANEKKKYFISQLSLLDLKDNTTHFKIEEKKVTIYVKATLKYIVENPILQINYLIDNLENARQDFLPQSYILEPKDINSNYSNSKDNKIYIHDKVKYVDNIYGIESVIINSRRYNYIKNKEELFFNTNALKLFNTYFKAKIYSEISETVKKQIVESNIKYLLRKIFLFYNNKIFKKYYIADTYIQYFDSSLTSTATSPATSTATSPATSTATTTETTQETTPETTSYSYYSITKGDIVEKNEKYKIISKLLETSSNSEPELQPKSELEQEPESGTQTAKTSSTSKSLFKLIKSTDARLENNKIYKINLIFRCYSDKNGKKPTIVRKLVAENCLSKAQHLDEAFTNTLYKAFRLPENYLYNKLANITSKQKPKTVPENKTNPVAPQQNIPNKRGGKITKKYNRNKNSRLKYNSIY